MENPTESTKIQPSPNFFQLTIKQQQAIEMLLVGKHDSEVAEAVGVGRDTLWRWRTQNSNFIAVWNELSLRLWTGLVSRLNHLFSRSVQVIEEAIEERDTEVALALVQALKGRVNDLQGDTAKQLVVLRPAEPGQKQSYCQNTSVNKTATINNSVVTENF